MTQAYGFRSDRKVLLRQLVNTGDVVRRDEQGNFSFVGRSTGSIRRRGQNISALEVEEGLERHPDIAVVGAPSELTEDVWIHCTGGTCRHQVSRYICFVDDPSKTPAGKVNKPHLRTNPPVATTWDRTGDTR